MFMYKYRILEVVRVISGDTLDVIIDLGFNLHFKIRIRLANINAPYIDPENEDEMYYGYRAKIQLEKYLQDTTNAIVATQNPNRNEKFQGVVGEVYVEGYPLTASEYLAANGYVWVYDEGDISRDLTLLASA